MKPTHLEITHYPERNCFSNAAGAILEYRVTEPGRVTFTHTYVPASLRGQNMAASITRFALQHAAAAGWHIASECSYTDAYLKRHPEFSGLLDRSDDPSS